MNTNYKFITRQQERPNTMPQPCNQACMPPQNYVPCQPWPFPYNPFMPPQQPIAVNKRFITNENEEFIIDPTNTKLNAFSYEVTDNYICSIDFDNVRIETNASSYQHCGPLTVTAYIRKDGSILFIIWNPYAGNDSLDFYGNDEEELINLPNPKLYTRTFTTEEIKSVGDHCMEKLLVAFMNEVLTAISK